MKARIILRYISIIGLFIFSQTWTFGQTTPKSAPRNDLVNWVTLDEAYQKAKIEKKKIFIELYTDWCNWCKKMEKKTFSQEHIARYLNEKYYSIRFNAQTKEDITFQGKKYRYIAAPGNRGYHELAAALMRGQLGYPTIVFLDEEMNLIQPIQGYKDPDVFEAIINYFGQNYHKKMPWIHFKKTYKPYKKAEESAVVKE